MTTIGDKIKEVRLQRGLTQSDLCADLCTPSMISQIEADRAKPSYALIKALASRLGMPADYFLSDAEQQYSLAVSTRLAEYLLLLEQPDKALEALGQVDPPDTPGMYQQEYFLLMARAHRLSGAHVLAIQILEELREQALRAQDMHLHFLICKESGYVEYAMKNMAGAMHEWERALSLGESLTVSSAERTWLQSELAELCLNMHRLHLRQGSSQAKTYLERAAVLCDRSGRIRDIAQTLVDDGMAAVSTDANRGRQALDRAVAIIDAARKVEQYILVHTKLGGYEGQAPAISPWTQAAIATATVDPGSFIEAELIRIEGLLDRGETHSATDRIHRALAILDDYAAELPEWTAQTSFHLHRCRLDVGKARILQMNGDLGEAIGILEQTVTFLEQTGRLQESMMIWARLVEWYAEADRAQDALSAAAELRALIDRFYPHGVGR